MSGYIEFSIPVFYQFTKTLPNTKPNMKMPLFSDNSKVCYKNHSLASCGVGSVRNSSRKAHKT